MSTSAFHALVGRAIADTRFREQLLDPEQRESALTSVGIKPTPEILEELEHSIQALNDLSESFREEAAAS